MSKYQKYHEAIAFIESLSNLVHKSYYSKVEAQTVYHKRMRAFLNFLGNPENKLKYVHITGTSGKGSTTNMCQSILQAAGYKTGLYQSPHITAFIERIKIDNEFISPEEVIELVDTFKKAIEKFLVEVEDDMLSYGELVFCMALYYFAKNKCDYVVVEVACGGLCDYTNVIPHADVTMITNIGKDHLHILGPHLTDVARAKSGIIKKGSTFFTTEKVERYKKIMRAQCDRIKASYNEINFDYEILDQNNTSSTFIYKDETYTVNLPGIHQIENALLAIEMAYTLKIPSKSIQKGLQNVSAAARMEIMQQNPMVILDSAHNMAKLESTFKTLERIRAQEKTGKLWVIFSFTSGKDVSEIMHYVMPKVDKLILTRHNHNFRQAVQPKDLLREAKKIKKDLYIPYFLKAQDALEYVLSKAKKNDTILITGSLYMAGLAREHWISKDYILKNRRMFKK